MIYRNDRNGEKISQLGFGCMRFARRGGVIDYAAAQEQILLAIERGINYFDTAYVYPGSEDCLGRVLADNGCRDKIKIATKLPQYLIRSAAAIDKIFREELRRLRTDHIDYYLMHMFTDIVEWERLQGFGIEDWIRARKAEGSIRNIGFSFHGNTETFLKLLELYDWDFCQIQYNYMDEHSQAGRRGLQAAAEKGLPVMIMEPLRGGRLVRLPEKARELLRPRGISPAELGLRWLWDQPEIGCVLSGMNSPEMVEENTRIAAQAEIGQLSEADHALVEEIRRIIKAREKVGCTGCRYCMPCPRGVDIPGNFHFYNLLYQEKKISARVEFTMTMGFRKEPGFATQCVGCGKCEQHCPQRLPIREKLKEADRALRPLPYRAALSVARKIMGR
ncbi:MAG: aldo/keto reductase [Oscillospiraceae bacterium]|nr:aldo/keto reductase [Oscillospiraceae bacterium]